MNEISSRKNSCPTQPDDSEIDQLAQNFFLNISDNDLVVYREEDDTVLQSQDFNCWNENQLQTHILQSSQKANQNDPLPPKLPSRFSRELE